VPARDDLGRTLSPFSWEGIEFPGEDVSTSFGHDSAQHKGFGTRGADIETTGPKAKVVRVKAVFLNGLRGWRGDALYPDTYQRVVAALEANPEGLLGHPTRGAFAAHFDEGSEEIRAPQRRGLTITLQFTEQQGSAELIDMGWTVVGEPAQVVIGAAAAADAAAPPGFLDSIVALLEGAASLRERAMAVIATLEEANDSYVAVVSALDGFQQTLATIAEDPAAAVVEANPFRAAVATTLAAVTRLRENVTGARVRRYIVPEEASLAMIAADPDVYGDASRAPELMASNLLLTPWSVAAGTVLTVVD
jgi:hypothetical protein